MAIPNPDPKDWQRANAQTLQVTDREVLAMLRDAKKRVDEILRDLPEGGVQRAQLERTRAKLLAEQSGVFTRLGDIVSARRASAASRAARLSAAADASLLSRVGKGPQAQYLYDSALEVGQRAIDTALQRMKYSALPLSQRIYNSNVWMNGRLGKLINETLASGLNASDFAKRARDWFNPNTPGGIRYAAMRLARTEINNAFHSISAQKYAETPWITEVEWNLSGSHLKPDVCNEYAAASPYPSDEAPARPHPQCLCYITPKSIEEEEFIDNFLKGDYDEYLGAELEKNGWNTQGNASKREEVEARSADELFKAVRSAADRGDKEAADALFAKAVEQRKKERAAAKPSRPEAPIKEKAVETDSLKAAKSRIKSSVKGELRAKVEQAMDKLHSVVGDDIKRVESITRDRKNDRMEGQFAFCSGGHVHLHNEIEQNKDTIAGFMGDGFLGGYFVKGDGDPLRNITAHEMGHAMLQRTKHLSLSREKELVQVVVQALGLPKGNHRLYELMQDDANKQVVRLKVSKYAARNSDELLAEVWADYVMNPKASPEVRTIGDAMLRIIKEGKRRA